MLQERVKEWTVQWKQEGLQEGRREGRRAGLREGEAQMLARLLERKFGPVSPEVRERLKVADAEELLVWGERLLTAQRLDEVFVPA
jgi:flagellar biosynthesis/type III secretory pathway protein FliH